MKTIYLTKHPSYLQNSFTEIKPHSENWKVGIDYEVIEYGTDNYLTTVQLVSKKTIHLDDMTLEDAYHYLDAPKDIVLKIWKSRIPNYAFMLFDVLLFSKYAASLKFLELNESNMHLYKDLCNPIKPHGNASL